MKLRKQNVFDDFIAAAEWLIAQKYTSPKKLAILGASNGGLLMGAVINQRPELFRAAVVQAGVSTCCGFKSSPLAGTGFPTMDRATIPKSFKALYAYSPLHNIRAGREISRHADHDRRS